MLLKKFYIINFITLFAFVLLSLYAFKSFAAMDCIGGRWVDGPKCSEMGLDTHAGVCRPGQEFETRCDDRRGSRGQTQHIVCQGTRRCYNPYDNYNDDRYDYNDYSCYEWDFDRDRPCRPGYVNYDCYGRCERERY